MASLAEHRDRLEKLKRASGYVAKPERELPSDDLPSMAGSMRRIVRTRKAGVQELRTPFIEWALRVPEPKTGRLDWSRFPFQCELYEMGATDKEAVVQKSTQVGVSAYLLRWVLYWADLGGEGAGLNALYVFPRRKQMYDFSDARVDAAIRKSEYLARRVANVVTAAGGHKKRGVDNKGLKKVGPGFVYFRGSEAEDDLDSVDADVLALDEYDRLKPSNVPVAERRIDGSAVGLIRRVGVPTLPNFGVAKKYQESDKRRWLVKCGCGAEQRLTWSDNVDQERALRVCSTCRRELRPEDVAGGRWAAEAPEVAVRGYHIPKLIVPALNLPRLIENSRKAAEEDRRAFWNRDLAEPYAPAEGRLSPEAIAASLSVGEREGWHMEESYVGFNVVTMGVDTASTRDMHVRISERLPNRRKRALWIGRCSDFNELALKMDRFQVAMAAVDAAPEYRVAQSFAERFPGRVYLVRYAGGNAQQVLNVKEELREAIVRRTEAIDSTFEGVRQQRNILVPPLPTADADGPGYEEQVGNLNRVVERDAAGRKVVHYVRTGRDDYANAEVYDTVAGDLWLVRQQAAEAEREVYSPLESHLEFERSALEDTEEEVYRQGGGGDGDYGYAAGFESMEGADADWEAGG